MKKLEILITALENNIVYLDKINTQISNSSVGWQLEHSLLTINRITEALKNSKAEEYR